VRDLYVPIALLALSACATQSAASVPAASIGRTWLDPTIGVRQDVSTALVVLESYRVALKHGEIHTLLALASDDYLDGSGTPEADDDVDRTGLAQALSRWNAIALTDLDLRVTHVARRGETLVLEVRYAIRVRIGGRQSVLSEEHEMVLAPRGRSWAFLSGM